MDTLLDHWKKLAGGGLFATGTVASLAYVTANPTLRGVWVTLAVIFLLALLTFLAWVAYRRIWVRRRRNQVESAVPVRKFGYEAVTGEEAEIRKEEMKDSLSFGVERLRELGMDLYELPWYLVMGYSSAGKSFVCQSLAKRIGTPEGMNKPYRDDLEGTYNLDWWFYNDAVFIDTAGRIAFQETPEWTTMLHGLRKARKDCPINGVFLVVGADELSKESDDELYERAKQLRKQLDSVKLKLQIRFPVYVIVTKGDLIEGFSEFFKDLPTQEKRDQIIGWSNGKDLDATVIRVTEDHGADSDAAPDPDYLNSILTPLKRWRMSTVGSAAPGGPVAAAVSEANYQLDNVDDGYGFPEALRETMRRLDRVYLQTIFGDRVRPGSSDSDEASSESTRPRPGGSAYTRHRARMRPFLRGIYLSSSRQGAPVNFDDDDRLESTSPKAASDRRIYFLKDLVLRKIFPERNLVTPDENISLGRKRLVLIASLSSACAILIALIFSFILSSKLDSGVTDDLKDWTTAAQLSKRTDLLSRLQNPASPVSGTMSLLAFHEHLQSRASKELDVPVVFLPFKLFPMKNVDRERREAQRVLFGGQIVNPLVQEVRRKLESTEDRDRVGALQLKKVLLDLIKIESGDHRLPSALVTNSMIVVGAMDLSTVESAGRLADLTYVNGGWPPGSLRQEGYGDQRKNSILTGVNKYLAEVRESAKGIEEKQKTAKELHQELINLRDTEKQIYEEMEKVDMSAQLAKLSASKSAVDGLVRNAVIAGSITSGMVGIFRKLDDEFIEASRPEMEDFRNLLPSRPPSLVKDVRDRLDSGIKNSNPSTGSLLSSPAEEEANKRLDSGWLAKGPDGKHAYGTRAKILLDLNVRPDTDSLFSIGSGFSNYLAWFKELDVAFSNHSQPEFQSQFKRLTNFLFQSKWDKGIRSRWNREYVSGPGGFKAKAASSRGGAEKLRNESRCSLVEMARLLEDINGVEIARQSAMIDIGISRSQPGRFVAYQQDHLHGLVDDVGKTDELRPVGTINILGYVSRFLRSPLGKGLPSLTSDEVGAERDASLRITKLLENKNSGLAKLIEEAPVLNRNLNFALATLRLMSDQQGVRRCKVSYDTKAENGDPSGFQSVYNALEIKWRTGSVKFNRSRNDEREISADSRLELRGIKGDNLEQSETMLLRTENEPRALYEWSLFQILALCEVTADGAAPDTVRIKIPTDKGRNIYLKVQFLGAGTAVEEWLKLKQEIK